MLSGVYNKISLLYGEPISFRFKKTKRKMTSISGVPFGENVGRNDSNFKIETKMRGFNGQCLQST